MNDSDSDKRDGANEIIYNTFPFILLKMYTFTYVRARVFLFAVVHPSGPRGQWESV